MFFFRLFSIAEEQRTSDVMSAHLLCGKLLVRMAADNDVKTLELAMWHFGELYALSKLVIAAIAGHTDAAIKTLFLFAAGFPSEVRGKCISV